MNTWFVRFLTCVLLAASLPLFAQFDLPKAMSGTGNPLLRSLKVGSMLPGLGSFGGSAWEQWSSSYLQAEGKPPAAPAPTGNEDIDFEADYEYRMNLDAWKSMYTARSLGDNNPASCWAEGVQGNGEGEMVIALVDATQGVYIRSGFQKSPATLSKNSRPQKIRVMVLRARRQDAGQYDTWYSELEVLAQAESTLKDTMGWQNLAIPSFTPVKSKPAGPDDMGWTDQTFVAIQILSVYPGSTWADTCISDISNSKQ